MRRIEEQVRWPAAEITVAKVHTVNRSASVPVWSLPALGIVAVVAWWMLSPVRRDTTASQPVAPAIAPLKQLPAQPAPHAKAPHVTQTQGAATQQTKPATSPASFPASDKQSKLLAVPEPTAPVSSSPPSGTDQLTDDLEKTLIGEWSGYYQGERQLKVAADGTGTMVAEPEGLAATLLAPKLTFQVKWKRNNDAFEFETVGGEPLDKVNIVVKMYGRKRRHKIVSVETNQIVLLDEDGVTKYVWKRKQNDKRAAPDPK